MTYNPNLADKLNRIVELEERLARAKRGKAKEGKEDESIIQPLILPESIQRNPRNYILVPQYNLQIAIQETHKGKNLYDTLDAVADEGLKVPSPNVFMSHWLNVKEAVVDKKRILYYADNTLVSPDIAEDLYRRLSSDHNGGCWTWLNAYFEQEGDKWFITTDLKTIKNRNKVSLQGNKQELESCLREDCFAELEFNSQGLAVRKSPNRNYSQGQNIKFWHPHDKGVARFVADSGGASLDCDGSPSDRSSALGVFACAEGRDTKN